MRSNHVSRGPAVRLGYVTEECIAREGLRRRFAGSASMLPQNEPTRAN